MKFLLAGLLLAALLVALVLWRARAHEMRAEAAFPPQGRILNVAGQEVHARVLGPEDGSVPDIVLIHGASGNLRDMSFDLAPRLAGRFRVIMFDRPGLGYSARLDGGGASIAQQADLLMRAARQLGADRPVVLGHSYGGAVALAWAVHHPGSLSALVPLAAASHPWKTGLSAYYRLLSHPVAGPLVIPLLTAFVPNSRVKEAVGAVFAPDPVPEGYLDHFGAGLALRRHTLRENALQRAGLLAQIEALQRHYPDIAVPTEIVHGTDDTTVGLSIHSEPLAAAIPGARLTRLTGTGHMPHHADPQAVIDAIHRVSARAGLRPGG